MIKSKEALTCLADLARHYDDCLKMTREALAWDSHNDEALVAEFLNRREVVLERIFHLEQFLTADFAGKMPDPAFFHPVERKKAGPLLESLKADISELVKLDRLLGEKIKSALGEVGEELKKYRLGRALIRAYAPYSGPGNARIMRLKG
ncbi:MAG: hypothetical protein V1816_28545 [Pseudomonadota bacterium]